MNCVCIYHVFSVDTCKSYIIKLNGEVNGICFVSIGITAMKLWTTLERYIFGLLGSFWPCTFNPEVQWYELCTHTLMKVTVLCLGMCVFWTRGKRAAYKGVAIKAPTIFSKLKPTITSFRYTYKMDCIKRKWYWYAIRTLKLFFAKDHTLTGGP